MRVLRERGGEGEHARIIDLFVFIEPSNICFVYFGFCMFLFFLFLVISMFFCVNRCFMKISLVFFTETMVFRYIPLISNTRWSRRDIQRHLETYRRHPETPRSAPPPSPRRLLRPGGAPERPSAYIPY